MIKLYTLKKCKYCEEAKLFLKENNIPFEEVDLTAKENREARKFYRELGIDVAPVITGINKSNLKWIVWGFDEDKKKEIMRLSNE